MVLCIFTRVDSRASSALTQSSLTGPARSEFLQMFPVKNREQSRCEILLHLRSASMTDELLVSSHLFNDNMFAMVVQPDRHFRGETKLP